MNLKQKLSKKRPKIIKDLHHKKSFVCVCVCMYKWLILTKYIYIFENNDTEVIVDGIVTLSLNEKHIEEKLGPNIYQSSKINMTQYTKSTDMN